MKKLLITIVTLLTLTLMGCSMDVSGRMYYPKENNGDVYKSRGVEKGNNGVWSWGDAR